VPRDAPEALQQAGQVPRPRRWRKWRTWAWLVLGLVCATLVTLAVAAAHYQPVSNGNDGFWTLAFPGMRTGNGIRQVNIFGSRRGDIYIPPQRGTFSISGTIANTGTHPVTIVSATPPTGLGLAQSGPPRYAPLGPPYSSAAPFSNSRPLHDLVLQPGQEVLVGFPVHMWPCAPADAVWYSVTDFTVTTRYLTFTRTVEVPFGPDGETLIMRGPGGQPGQKDVICAPGTTKANLPPLPQRDSGPQPVAGTIIRVYHGHNTGELRLIQMTAPDAAADLGIPLPPCFTQYPPWLTRLPGYRVINFDLNYAGINEGSGSTGPNVRVTIAGPDGTSLIAAVPQGPADDTVACQPVRSFLLTSGGSKSQEVLGLTLRVPVHLRLDHLLVTAGGHTITAPLVPDCSRRHAPASGCFDGSSLGGPWIAGTPYSVSLRP
jgi:hypothetical protein